MKMDGGVDAVRVVPIRMQEGGDPAEKLLAEGPPGPNFQLRECQMKGNDLVSLMRRQPRYPESNTCSRR